VLAFVRSGGRDGAVSIERRSACDMSLAGTCQPSDEIEDVPKGSVPCTLANPRIRCATRASLTVRSWPVAPISLPTTPRRRARAGHDPEASVSSACFALLHLRCMAAILSEADFRSLGPDSGLRAREERSG
jgi:hypothetical protein